MITGGSVPLPVATHLQHHLPVALSQNRQADTDRITAEHDYRVNQLALQHLIAWHRDSHGPDCSCVRQVGSAAEGLLAELSRDL
jgi:hypothetical protein